LIEFIGRRIKERFRSIASEIDPIPVIGVLALVILVTTATSAQTASSPSKSQPVPVSSTIGVGRNPADATSGFIFGSNWMVTFHGMPADWTSETGIANQIGVQEIFHPQHWNPRQLAPSMMFSFCHKEPGDETAAANMANDVRRTKGSNPETKIISAPALAISATEKAPVRIFEYQQGWDRVVYSEEGNVLYVSTLHCENAAQCAPLESTFAKFVESLDYTGNVTVVDKRKHH
jgi:hypothetical protein